jgi:hypothetical protein
VQQCCNTIALHIDVCAFSQQLQLSARRPPRYLRCQQHVFAFSACFSIQERQSSIPFVPCFMSCRSFYQQHLQEQQEHVAKLQRALQATAATTDADALDAAGMDVAPRAGLHTSSGEGAAVQLADDVQTEADQQL